MEEPKSATGTKSPLINAGRTVLANPRTRALILPQEDVPALADGFAHEDHLKAWARAFLSSSHGEGTLNKWAHLLFEVGSLYGRDGNLEIAFACWKAAADNGAHYANADVGGCFLTGTGTLKDLAAAKEYFTRGANSGDNEALYGLQHIFGDYASRAIVSPRKDSLPWWLVLWDNAGETRRTLGKSKHETAKASSEMLGQPFGTLTGPQRLAENELLQHADFGSKLRNLADADEQIAAKREETRLIAQDAVRQLGKVAVGSVEEGRVLARQINAFVATKGFRFRYAKTEYPANLNFQPSGELGDFYLVKVGKPYFHLKDGFDSIELISEPARKARRTPAKKGR